MQLLGMPVMVTDYAGLEIPPACPRAIATGITR